MTPDNTRHRAHILAPALASLALYAVLAREGPLRDRPLWMLVTHAALVLLMLAGWRLVRREGRGMRWALAAALLFRLAAGCGEPALSDDVHRYVWDGRTQLHGIHPYRHAPDDPALSGLRDENWTKINHPNLRTIYPPLSQVVFLILAALGAGPLGFKLAIGLLDFGLVLALNHLLRTLSLPQDRVVLYAWNPLVVIETAGSGHVEPLGVLFVVLAATWIIKRRAGLSTIALAGAIHAKLLPVVLLPCYLRRLRRREVLLLVLVVAALWAPYALSGPPLGSGLLDYAERWERNAPAFEGTRTVLERLHTGETLRPAVDWLRVRVGEGRLPWDSVYRWTWPGGLARLLLGTLAVAWLALLALRGGLDAARESYLALGGVLLLAPTLHPWYLIWVLPFAAAYRSWGWLGLAVLAPLSYLPGDAAVPWWLLCIEYSPLPAWLVWGWAARRRGDRALLASRP